MHQVAIHCLSFQHLLPIHHLLSIYCFLDPLSLVRDHRVKEVLTAQGIAVRSFNADLLYEPWDVNDAEGRPFTTFAAFWDRCLSMPFDPEAPLLPPKRIISGLSSFKLFFLMVPHFYAFDLRECLVEHRKN